MSFWESLTGKRTVVRVSQLPQNPVKGKVYEVAQNGRKLGYEATGASFPKFKICYNEPIG